MRILAILLALFQSLVLFARENYIPMLRPSNQWNTISRKLISGVMLDQKILRLDADTLIKSFSYYRLIESKDSLKTWNTVGYVREDVPKRKVYLFDGGQEYLLYDFDVQVGDRVDLYKYRGIVKKVDRILIDGVPRKRVYLDNGDSWVEGIGALYGSFLQDPYTVGDNMANLIARYTAFVQKEHFIYTPIDETNIWGIIEKIEPQPGCDPSDDTYWGDYNLMLRNTARQWNTIELIGRPGDISGEVLPMYRQVIYRIPADTVIDGLRYRKLIASADSMATWQEVGCLREDTAGCRIYYWRDGKESLLYDFSLEVGDVVHYAEGKESVVEYVDSLVLGETGCFEDDILRCIHFKVGDQDEMWIEGVGSNRGGLIPCYDDNPELPLIRYAAWVYGEKTCYVDKSFLSYSDDIWGACRKPYLLSDRIDPSDPPLGSETVVHDGFNWSVQGDRLLIESDQPRQVYVYTIHGRLAFSGDVVGLRGISLTKGLYVVCVGDVRMKVFIP